MCPIHACVAQPVCVSISRQPTCPQGQALIEVMNAREPKWRRIKLLVRLLGVMDLPQLGWWVVSHSQARTPLHHRPYHQAGAPASQTSRPRALSQPTRAVCPAATPHKQAFACPHSHLCAGFRRRHHPSAVGGAGPAQGCVRLIGLSAHEAGSRVCRAAIEAGWLSRQAFQAADSIG